MWLKIMDWMRESNNVQIMIIAVPMAWFTFKYCFTRFRKTEEDEKDQHHDWIGNLEEQLKQFEQHSRKIEEMELNFEYVPEDNNPKKKNK